MSNPSNPWDRPAEEQETPSPVAEEPTVAEAFDADQSVVAETEPTAEPASPDVASEEGFESGPEATGAVIPPAPGPQLTLDEVPTAETSVTDFSLGEPTAVDSAPAPAYPPAPEFPPTTAYPPVAAYPPPPAGAPTTPYGQATPAYGQPGTGYGAAAYDQQAAQQNYGQPAPPVYGQPTPPPPYGQPTDAYGQPAPPTPPYGQPAPQPPYGAPSTPYGAPPQAAYQQPAAAFDPLTAGYGQPPAPGGYPMQPYQPGYPAGYAEISPAEEATWASAAHWSPLLLNLAGLGFLGPLIILLVQGGKSARVRANAVESLNFELTFIIAMIVSVILILLLVGIALVIVIPIVWFILRIVAAVAASNGQDYRYPLNIRMVK